MMRRLLGLCAAFAVAVAPGAASAQTHVVKKPETVVRAIGVFEWTGDEPKPTASRLVPVSVFINNQLEDAGIYMARPVPFALYTGTIFEVQKSGMPEGTVQLAYERHLEGNSATQFDDGWLGYGLFKPASQASVFASTRKSGPLPQVVASGGSRPRLGNKTNSGTTTASADDSSRPTMRRRTDSDSSDTSTTGDSSPTAASASNDDSSRPTMRRRTDSTASDSSGSADATPVKTSSTQTTTASDDPDRPVLKRRSDSSDTADTSADASTGTPSPASSTGDSSKTASSDDPNRPTMRRRDPDATDSIPTSTTDPSDEAERPTLKKRTPPSQGKSKKQQGDTASVSSVGGSLNDDPDRPTLHRGSGSESPDSGIPPLNGLPADMHQRVAVSDAKDRPEHDFARPWESDSEREDILAKMQEFARARLAKYDVPAPRPPDPEPAPAKTSGAKGKKPVAPAPPPPTPVELTDESLRGYTLSYGGSATFIYSASSPGVGGATRYVSIVAQRELLGEPKVALSSVTDTTHLDRTPWMRLIDVVDAEASNRASLLFELRGQSSRQFALYRVIGSTAEQIFQTGTTE